MMPGHLFLGLARKLWHMIAPGLRREIPDRRVFTISS